MKILIILILLLSLFALEMTVPKVFCQKDFKDTWDFTILYFIIVVHFFAWIFFLEAYSETEEKNINTELKEITNFKNFKKEWLSYLNEVVSLFCLSGAVSSISTNHPSLYALIFLGIILFFTLYKSCKVDPLYYKIMLKFKKTNKDKEYLNHRKAFIKQEFNLSKVGFDAFFYFFGAFILIAVILMNKQALMLKSMIENH